MMSMFYGMGVMQNNAGYSTGHWEADTLATR